MSENKYSKAAQHLRAHCRNAPFSVFIACVFSFAWVESNAAETAPVPVVSIVISADGCYKLGNNKYCDPKVLKTKLDEINRRNPRPNLALIASHSTNMETVKRAIDLFQRAGIPKFALLMEPSSN